MQSIKLSLVLSFLTQLVHAQIPNPAGPSHARSNVLPRAEVPTAYCPTDFANPPLDCDSAACGGQGAIGVCKNNSGGGKPCQCQVRADTSGAPTTNTPPSTTMVTTTDAKGSTIIAAYQLITVDNYKSLRQEQTVTISQTTTGSDGQATVAAAAAVIAAAGVAWILGTTADAAGAAILKPPPAPEANKNDPSCPTQKHKCQDCGAIAGLAICVTPDAGCACEVEQTCPTGDTKLQCSDKNCTGVNGKCTVGDPSGCPCKDCPANDQQPYCDEDSCKGKDNKCTTGDNEGCGCREAPCPESRYRPFCNFCGGKANDGKCNGIAEENNLWKGCQCLDFLPMDNFHEGEQQPLADDIPDITPSSYSYGGNNPLKCLKLGYGAKSDEIRKSVLEWCKSVDGKKLDKSGDKDVLYKRYSYDYYSYWLGAQYDTTAGCGDSADIREISCVSTMLDELDDCNAGEPEFQGAELTDGCVKYHISLSRSTNDNDPPFKPLPQNLPDCNKDDVTSVAFNFWQGVSKKFCADLGDGKSAKKAELRNTDLQTRSLFGRTPPPSSKSYPDWKFFFEWEPKESGLCAKGCEEAMATFANSCGHYGGQQNSMVKKGSMDVGCGTYAYSLGGPPEPPRDPNDRDTICHITFGTFFNGFDVSDNRHWIKDGGEAFKKEIKGCGAMTGWDISSGQDKGVHFNLPLIMKIGCVERAIQSAGGPSISCEWAPLGDYFRMAEVGEHNLTQGGDPNLTMSEKLNRYLELGGTGNITLGVTLNLTREHAG